MDSQTKLALIGAGLTGILGLKWFQKCTKSLKFVLLILSVMADAKVTPDEIRLIIDAIKEWKTKNNQN